MIHNGLFITYHLNIHTKKVEEILFTNHTNYKNGSLGCLSINRQPDK